MPSHIALSVRSVCSYVPFVITHITLLTTGRGACKLCETAVLQVARGFPEFVGLKCSEAGPAWWKGIQNGLLYFCKQ
jgi:hypothetical protein